MALRLRSLIGLALICLALAPQGPALAQSGAITGLVFADANGNGLYDPGEQGIGGVPISFSGVGEPVNGTTNADGSYFFTANLGAWTVTVTPPPGFEAVNGAAKSVDISAAEQSVVLDFGLRPIQVQVTNTVPPASATPGLLPTTGAPIGGASLTLAALAVVFLVGLLLLLSAWRRGHSRP